MTPTKSLLLAGTAMLMLAIAAPAVKAAASGERILLAQAAPQHEGDKDKKAPDKGAAKPAAKPAHEAQPKPESPKPAQAQQKPAEKAAPPPQQQQAQPKPPEHKPPEKPAAAQQRPDAPKAAQQERKPEPKPEAKPEAKPAAKQDEKPAAKPTAKQDDKPDARKQETAKPAEKPNTAAKPDTPEQKPAAADKAPEKKPAAAAAKPEQAPAKAEQKPSETPAAQKTETKPAAAPDKEQQPSAAEAKPDGKAAPAAAQVAPPDKPQSAQQFILPKNGKPTATIQDLRKERHERREGNRTIITEGDRTIVKQDNRTIIRHNETQRFAVGARDVDVRRHGNETTTVVVRPNGVRIVNVTDARGHLIRRVRRDRSGKEIVIIDQRRAGPRVDVFVDLPPPRIRIPRDRYIVELDRARPQVVYEVLDARPVERIEERYTVDQVRYSAPLRARMPRVDLDIHFETGSWQLTPDQIDKLSVVAEGLNRAISRSPREVFLIEGHTDAVGSDEDNLSLSDRRAESVAVALTEQFQVPPENLVTQGYGEQDLKVKTEEASRENRRVSVRRITPLIDQQAAR